MNIDIVVDRLWNAGGPEDPPPVGEPGTPGYPADPEPEEGEGEPKEEEGA